MAKYTFGLQSYDIKKTRSRHRDTNYISAALSVDGHMVGSPQLKFMGDQDDGTFPVGFKFPDVEVPEGSTVILFYYILNNGHANQLTLEKAINDAISDQMEVEPVPPGEEPPSKDFWEILAEYFVKYALPLVFANCDGPITPKEGRQIIWSSFDLKGIAPGTTYKNAQDEPGNDSPHGCGPNSHYIVHYTVTPV